MQCCRVVPYQKVVSDESSIELTPLGQRCFAEGLDLVEVNLMRAKPDCAGKYYEYFRYLVIFSSAHNNIILPHEVMEVPLP
jgi:hypothetical protein